MEMTGKSEDVVVIALHDSGNDAERAANMLLEGDEQVRDFDSYITTYFVETANKNNGLFFVFVCSKVNGESKVASVRKKFLLHRKKM